MSRSIRKNPYLTDQQSGATKLVKRQATRVVRKSTFADTPQNGKSYRKSSCSWNIRDWSAFTPNNKKAIRK